MIQNIPNSIDHNILNRKSLFSFSSKHVEEEKLSLIFEAARWAPSSFNAQPWRYIYTRKDEEGYKDLFSLLADGNKIWAYSAPILILTLTEVFDVKKKRSNRFAFHDLGLSTAMLMLQAGSLGLFTHPMGGFDVDRAKTLFDLPSGFEPGAMIALGYPGDPSKLPEDIFKRHNAPRIRKNPDEFVFKGNWKG